MSRDRSVKDQRRIIDVRSSTLTGEAVSRIATKDAQRFWAKADRTGSCWLWRGSINKSTGYGTFTMPKSCMVGGRSVYANQASYAHRFAFELANGPIPDGQSVLHRCDVPACVNPEHLFLGTHRDNMRDAAAKGRLHVPRPFRQTVSNETVSQILTLAATGTKQADIARQFRVSKTFVSLLIRGKRRQYSRSA